MRPLMEVCVDSIESIIAAHDGGADRIELCSALEVGGLTPSLGLLIYSKELYPKLPIYPMIRPRSGDFLYTDKEIILMQKDIETMKKYADGFVFGILQSDGSVDVKNCKTLLDAASPLPCTFHRAFDVTNDPVTSLEEITRLGFERILTSGQSKTAESGIKTIANMVKLAQNRIIIMPGTGINTENLSMILNETKASEFHASASKSQSSKMTFYNTNISMGDASAKNEYQIKVCDAEKVKQMIGIANKTNN